MNKNIKKHYDKSYLLPDCLNTSPLQWKCQKHNRKLQYHLYDLLFTLFIHFSKGTVEVYKAHVKMKLPLYMLGLAMRHRPNYPEVCLLSVH